MLERDPVLVDLLERTHPVIENLSTQRVAADAAEALRECDWTKLVIERPLQRAAP